jgi:WD40 repeat protein
VAAGAWGPVKRSRYASTTIGTLQLWDAESGEVLWCKESGHACVRDVAFSPDERLTACCDAESVRLVDSSTGATVRVVMVVEPLVGGTR